MTSYLLVPRLTRAMVFRLGLMLATLPALAGCSVATSEESLVNATANECSADQDCGEGACSSGMCQSADSQLRSLLLEITPPAGTERIAGVRFFHVLENFGLSEGELDVELGHVSQIAGQVTGATVTPSACVAADEDDAGAAADGTLPVRVTFVPRQRLLGLPNPAQTREVPPGEETSYGFSLSVPPGKYDIYVEPLASDGNCVRPPHLLVDQEIVAGDIDLELELPEPQQLEVAVRWPTETDALSGWIIDIVERDSGRRLSNRATLSDPALVDGQFRYTADLAFSEVVGDSSMPSTELVRLTPPEGVTAPLVYFERSVVQLFQDGMGVIDQLEDLPSSVRFTGRVNQRDTSKGVPATVTLQATELEQVSPGTVALFSRTVETDEEGAFSVDLLPGTYDVLVKPTQQGFASAESSLIVAADGATQGGKVIDIDEQRPITGVVRAFDGTLATGVPVEAVPPPVPASGNVFELVANGLRRIPRATGDVSDQDGKFSLLADAGIYNVVARPEPSTGFAWGFALGVEVEDEPAEIGVLPLSLPHVLTGVLSSSDIGIVPSALIRAYAYMEDGELTSDADAATGALAVGEARVNEDGEFRLLLPSRIR